MLSRGRKWRTLGNMNPLRFSLLFSLVMTARTMSLPAAPPMTPGSYRDWNGKIDEVVVKRSFRADDYADIQVAPLDITKVTVPERKGESRAAIEALLPSLKPAFMEGLQKNLRRRTKASASGKVLLIRVHLTKADPGTRSPGFGDFKGHAAKLAVRGEVIDRATHRTLIEFKQERWAGLGSITKNAGQLFDEAARAIGADVARLISAF